uniref:Uncharacterized protein n=1 Tax=Aegilops tauschii subsp. strangulata TaxID=200361 RepID=A0A453BUY7_AEGTS
FPLLVPLLVPHGEPWEGEGSIFVIDLLSDGGGLPRAWRARAVPSRRRSALRDAACLPGPSPLAQPRLPPWSSRSRPTQSRRPELRRSTLPPPSSWGPDCGRGGACPCRPAAPAPTGSSTSPAAPATLPSSGTESWIILWLCKSSPSTTTAPPHAHRTRAQVLLKSALGKV